MTKSEIAKSIEAAHWIQACPMWIWLYNEDGERYAYYVPSDGDKWYAARQVLLEMDFGWGKVIGGTNTAARSAEKDI